MRKITALPVSTVALAVAVLGSPAGAAPSGGATSRVSTGSDLIDTQVVAQLTGTTSLNRTNRYGVNGTDLGHMFLKGGRRWHVFGDTFGAGGTDHRSNTMARSTDSTLDNGVKFDGWVTDRKWHAKELLAGVIPTYGIAVGDRMFLHYMQVREWGPPGEWIVARSGVAYSDDNGETWAMDGDVVWPEGSNFAQVAMLRDNGDVYLFGIPGGRFGGVKLARVPEGSLLKASEYRYWTGSEWLPGEENAVTVVPAPVGELSVRWSGRYNKWLMTYLNDNNEHDGQDAIVLRSAESLTGSWSGERVLTTSADYPQLYAPYQVPDQADGQDLYFTMSRFDVYNVFLMRSPLPPNL